MKEKRVPLFSLWIVMGFSPSLAWSHSMLWTQSWTLGMIERMSLCQLQSNRLFVNSKLRESIAGKQIFHPVIFCGFGCRSFVESTCVLQVFGRDQRASADAFEQIGLLWLQGHKACKHV